MDEKIYDELHHKLFFLTFVIPINLQMISKFHVDYNYRKTSL